MAGNDDDGSRVETLMQQVEEEAARRRAAADFSNDLEAGIEAELARYAPAADDGGLERLVGGVAAASLVNVDAPTAARWRGLSYLKVALKRLLSWYLRHVTEQVSVLGLMTARALATLTSRLENLEERVDVLAAPDPARVIESRPSNAASNKALTRWIDELLGLMAPVEGRVLYAGADADAMVNRFRAGGLDAYGITGEGSAYRSSADTRKDDLLAHLDTVADGVLGGVVLAGGSDGLDGQKLGALIERLARVVRADGRVAMVAEAPWWWRLRVGPVEADLATAWPMAAETWIAGLAGSGFEATARYATDGRSFVVSARRQATWIPR